MHLAEALMTREEAVRMATETLAGFIDRCGPYFARKPELLPDPNRPVLDAVRAEDAWFFVPFERQPHAPVMVRVNALTKVAHVDHKA